MKPPVWVVKVHGGAAYLEDFHISEEHPMLVTPSREAAYRFDFRPTHLARFLRGRVYRLVPRKRGGR